MTAIEEMLMMARCSARMIGISGGEDAALEVDRDTAVSASSVRSSSRRRRPADADIVMQDIDAAPAYASDTMADLGLPGDVGLEGHRSAAFGADHVDGLLRRSEL
jgi:hypothetical protein